MIMSHTSHHQQMREWAKQDKPVQQDIAQRDFEKKHRCKRNYRNQAAQDHDPHVRFFHE